MELKLLPSYNGTLYGSSTEIYNAGSTAGAASDITTDNAAAVPPQQMDQELLTLL